MADGLLQSDLDGRDKRQDSSFGLRVGELGNKEGGDDVAGHVNPVYRSCRMLAKWFLEGAVE